MKVCILLLIVFGGVLVYADVAKPGLGVALRPIIAYDNNGKKQKHVKVLVNDGSLINRDFLDLIVISDSGHSLSGVSVTLKYKDKTIAKTDKVLPNVTPGGGAYVSMRIAKGSLATHRVFDIENDVVAFVKAVVK